MAPTDSSQMMSQMAQFTSVEQLTNLSTSMTALQMNQDFAGSVSLIGRSVTYQAADHSQVTGTVTAVTADKSGAILTVDGKQVNSGDIVKVQ
jgi:flagellar basal-body rod modification protein FlgD